MAWHGIASTCYTSIAAAGQCTAEPNSTQKMQGHAVSSTLAVLPLVVSLCVSFMLGKAAQTQKWVNRFRDYLGHCRTTYPRFLFCLFARCATMRIRVYPWPAGRWTIAINSDNNTPTSCAYVNILLRPAQARAELRSAEHGLANSRYLCRH